MQAVIIAGGFGTRLANVADGLPKPMVPVKGKPLLQYQVELAKAHGCTRVLMLLHHQAQVIMDHFGNGADYGLEIDYFVEEQPMGTAGAVMQVLDRLEDRFFVFYGDTMMDIDLTHMMTRHRSSGAAATLLVHPNDHPYDSDLVEADDADRITALHRYPHPPDRYFDNLVNAACYVIERDAMAAWAGRFEKGDFAKDLFPAMVADGIALHAYRSREYIKDMGTPDRLEHVERAIDSGLVSRLSRRNACPCVFLDRDGTLNREVNRVSYVDQLEMLDGVGQAVRRLNKAGILAVLVTNQPVVARGDCTPEGLRDIHRKLTWELGRDRAYLDALSHCPHHPDSGFDGEVPELKFVCPCRKPATGMIDQAVADLGVDLSRSWMVGDTTVDMMLARKAGLRGILVRTGAAGEDGRYDATPEAVCGDLSDAVDLVLERM